MGPTQKSSQRLQRRSTDSRMPAAESVREQAVKVAVLAQQITEPKGRCGTQQNYRDNFPIHVFLRYAEFTQ